jgi:transposase
MVGYRRFEGLEAATLLAQLYRSARLFVNFFQPSLRRGAIFAPNAAECLIRARRQGQAVLQRGGMESYVVDPASIAMSRRRRRAKTDRIDGEALVRALLAYKRGEPRVCAMVRAPDPEEEDRRRVCRERRTLTAERVQHVNRIKGLLFSQGISGYDPLRSNRRRQLDELKTGDGRPLPSHFKAQITRELDRLELLIDQIKAVEAERDALFTSVSKPTGTSADSTPAPTEMLVRLNGIGVEIAAVLWSEGLYRSFTNRKQVAAYAGLAPTPWQSGSIAHEQGVSKAGNPRLRTTMIQLSWLWLRHQPQSALTHWFTERVRACEIAGLDWSMVLDPQGRVSDTVCVRDAIAKKRTGRRIPLHHDLRRALGQLARTTEPIGPVIRSCRGTHFDPKSVVNWFLALYRELGFEGCSSHSGRRSFITMAARNIYRTGGSLRDVQLLAGHRSIETTERYIDGDTIAQRRLVSSI